MKKLVWVLPLCLTALCCAQNDESVSTALRAKDQALLDAIAIANRAVWDQALASDFIYVDENMRTLSRSVYLKELQPLPKGASGTLSIASYSFHRIGDTAIVVHRDNETESYFGSELHAEYIMTETWQQIGGAWKLRLVHCAAIPVDAPTIELSTSAMDELVGEYQAGSLRYTIRRDGNRLFGSRQGKAAVELKAETRDVLITPEQPRSMKVFKRDHAGKVIGFVDRRENRDLVWQRE